MTDELSAVATQVRECTRCQLSEHRTNAVPGIGGAVSGVVFVGEAPGRNEDFRGRPFVGKAGQILNEALRNAKVSRDSVYITNTVKCRPPKNRVPHQSERDACRSHLDAELRILRPLVICILGNTAYGSILGGSEITKNRGRLIRRDNILYFVTIHPAAAIYNPELVGVLKADIQHLFDIVKDIQAGKIIHYDDSG